MSAPSLAEIVLLTLASYRVWRLLAEDTILDRPRARALRLGSWRKEGDPVPDAYRVAAGEFLQCAWCAGFWVSLAWWGAWLANDRWALALAAPFAISALVGFARVRLDPSD